MFMSCRFPLQPRHVDGVLYVDFYGISTVNSDQGSSSRSPPQQEVERLSVELIEVTRERMYNVMEIGELKAQLAKQTQATENCEAMLSRMVEERNAAIAREEEARSAHRQS